MSITLTVGSFVLKGINNKKNRSNPLDKRICILQEAIKQNTEIFLNLQSIKEYQTFIASVPSVIDSQKIAPEVLIDMILSRGRLPTISRVVDTMNLISVEKGVTISIWDQDRINGKITYKLSHGGEKYRPFMGDEVSLLQGELVASDTEKVLCLVRYRDSDYAPVNVETKNIVVHIQGVGRITEEYVSSSLDELEKMLLANVGGEISEKVTTQSVIE